MTRVGGIHAGKRFEPGVVVIRLEQLSHMARCSCTTKVVLPVWSLLIRPVWQLIVLLASVVVRSFVQAPGCFHLRPSWVGKVLSLVCPGFV